MNRQPHRYLPVVALALCLCGAGLSARADQLVNVAVNTSSLAGMAGSEVFWEMTDGSGSGDANNTATMSNFALGGGTVGAVDPFSTFGGASGDLGSTVSITDSSPDNQFAQLLTPGASLSFSLDLTTNADAGGIPDGLFMFIADPSFNSIAQTSDPNGQNSLFAVTFNPTADLIQNYDPALVSITSAVTAVPEDNPASTYSAFALLLGGLAVLRSRRRNLAPCDHGSRTL